MSQKAGSTIRIDDDIAEDVRVRLARERLPLSRLINAYLRTWLAGGVVAVTADPSGPYLPQNRGLHDKLESILNSGDEGTIRAVVPNIEIFFERLKPSPSKRRSG